jgi:hypothetical protein
MRRIVVGEHPLKTGVLPENKSMKKGIGRMKSMSFFAGQVK